MKYIIFQCDLCRRQTELLEDARRPDPPRCNITLKCRGLFHRVGTRGTRKTLFPPAAEGLLDYLPRGTEPVSALPLAESPKILAYTGAEPILALACLTRTVGAQSEFFGDTELGSFLVEQRSASFEVPLDVRVQVNLYQVTPDLLYHVKYTYLIPGIVQIVTGVDISPEHKILNFTEDDRLKVFVNGIELDESEYDRSVLGQIRFTPAISGTNNLIQILVYRDLEANIDTDNLSVLEFRPLQISGSSLETRALSCWGDVTEVTVEEESRIILYCTDFSDLTLDQSYGVYNVEVTSTLTSETRALNKFDLLIGREPFAFSDKELRFFLDDVTMLARQAVFTYQRGKLGPQLFVGADFLTEMFNPLVPSEPIDNLTQSITPTEVTDAAEQLTPSYVIGPS